MHRRFYILITLILLGPLVTACNNSAPPIKPAADRPTFLYFYTEN
jgi:hypothetical protein